MKKQKGQALLIVILCINIFLVVVLVTSNLMLKEMKIQGNIDDSMAAYYAAEAGMEKAVLDIKDGVPSLPYNSPIRSFSTGYTWQYSIENSDPYIIHGIGMKNDSKREIQATVKQSATGGIFWPENWKEITP